MKYQILKHLNVKNVASKITHSSYEVDFKLGILGRFKIESCIHIDYYVI